MAILPSELCRLVLGFLEEQNLPETCKTFLGECRYLEECRIFSDRGVPFIKTVHGKKLVDYVNRNYLSELKSVETQTDSEPPLIASNSPPNNQQSHVNKRKNTQVKKRTSQIVLNSSHVVVEASESPKHAGNVNSSFCNHGNSDNIGTVDTNTTNNANLLLDEIDIDPKHLITDLFIENLCQQGFPDKLAQLINARAKTTTSTTTLSPSVVRTSLSNQHNLNSSMNMNITTTNVDENPSTTAISSEATTSTQAANNNTNNNFSTDYSNSTNEAASSSKPTEETTTTTTANQSISGAHFQEEIVIVSSSSSSNQNIDHDRQQKTNECTFDSMYNALTGQDLVLQDQDANIKWPDFLTNNEGISGIADLFCEEATLTLHNIFTSNVQEDGEDEGEEVAESPESEVYYNLNDQMNTPKKIGSNKRPYSEETESQKKRPRSVENDSNGDSNHPNTTHVIPVDIGIGQEPISSKKPRNHETNEEKERQVAKIGEPIFSTNKERTSAIIISKCARDKELALRKLGKSTNELREETQTEIRPIETAPNEISTSTQIDISMSSEIMSQTQNDISISGEKKRRNKPNRKPTIQQIFENSLKSPSPNAVETPPIETSQIDQSLSQETTTTTTTTKTATNKKKIAPLKKIKKHFNDFSKSIFNDQ